MIDDACFGQSKHRHAPQGLQAAQIAPAWTLDPRPVSSGRAPAHCHPRQPRPRSSTREPFQAPMVRMLERSPSSAAQVCQPLRARDFDGGYALVKASGRPVRPRRQAACLTRAWAPGACAQGDGGALGSGPVGQTHRPLRCLVIVLGSRRMLDVECTVSQTLEPFVAGPQQAWEFFGGIPHNVMVDNLTSAGRKRARGDAPVFQPQSLDFAPPTAFPWPRAMRARAMQKAGGKTGWGP